MDDLRSIENEFKQGLANAEMEMETSENKTPILGNEDFISDDTVNIIVRYKALGCVSFFARGLGKEAENALKSLYEPNDLDRRALKQLIQYVIREFFPDHIEKIKKLDSMMAAYFLAESFRAIEARNLRNEFLKRMPQEKVA